ncbi:MAG TPA: hypothetical protein VN032_11740 [Thermoanaerobaculia bacterium]|jgi:hypothetical protein|nr:hypothetical protein [Thermoanaerobaculia bacterium]
MSLAAWMLVLASAVPSPSPGPDAARLGGLARAVLSADYRGDRPELARLDNELERLPDGPLSDYRDYWRGFAAWRRAMNGFNETPTPTDLTMDLQNAVARFQAALGRRPEWIEARLAMVGCWGNLLFLAGKDEARRKALLEEALPSFRWLMQNAGDNPRALWIKGGMEMSAPPPTGGDFAKAAATLEHGLVCAWRESLSSAGAPAWEPRWGGPENLMDLAYLYSHSPKAERGVALAYARGALTAVPEWHYVRDVLLPQIEALPPPAPAP